MSCCAGWPAGGLPPGVQQAPGFCAQKSSYCWVGEPGGGVAVAAPVAGAWLPPDVEPVEVLEEEEVCCVAVWPLLAPLEDAPVVVTVGVTVAVAPGVAVAAGASAAPPGVVSCTGGPGTSLTAT
jgi:hypothetical protein